MLGVLLAGLALVTPTHHWDNNFTLCHATGEPDHYVKLTLPFPALALGHYGLGHQQGRDIIPPFEVSEIVFSQRWDSEGQAIFNNGCEVPPPPPPPAPTPTPTPEPTVVAPAPPQVVAPVNVIVAPKSQTLSKRHARKLHRKSCQVKGKKTKRLRNCRRLRRHTPRFTG